MAIRTAGLVLILVGLPVSSSTLAAWDDVGHRVIARATVALIAPSTARTIEAILENPDLVTALLRVDPAETGTLIPPRSHVVDIPFGAGDYDERRDCIRQGDTDCVVAMLLRGERLLGAASRLHLMSANQRKSELKRFVHLVGDVHQPLNCIDNQDGHGGAVKIRMKDDPSWAVGLDLRALWEGAIRRRRAISEEEQVTRVLQLAAGDLPIGRGGAYVAWALESHAVALESSYRYPGFQAAVVPQTPVLLDSAYADNVERVTDRQLALASIRLARTLDAILR